MKIDALNIHKNKMPRTVKVTKYQGGSPALTIRRRSDEVALIDQIKLQPILYDKTLPDYRKPSPTEKAWNEVAHQTGIKVDDCKKRWKSLRDTFIKYFRLELLSDAPINRKKKTWIFYENLSYLKPHVELFRLNEAGTPADTGSNSSQTVTIYQTAEEEEEEVEDKKTGTLQQQSFKVLLQDPSNEYEEYEIYETTDNVDETERYTIEEATDENADIYLEDDHIVVPTTTASATSTVTSNVVQSPVKSKSNPITVDLPVNSTPIVSDATVATTSQDPDEKFLLSCAPVLKRLPPQRNALLKLKIQQLLYEFEWGSEEEDTSSKKRRNN